MRRAVAPHYAELPADGREHHSVRTAAGWAHPCDCCTGAGLTPATAAPGLGWAPNAHRNRARHCRTCAASAPGLGPPPAHICSGTGPTHCAHLRRDWACTGTGVQLTAELTRLTDEVDRLHREWADPHSKARACETAHSCAPPNVHRLRPGWAFPHLHRDWAHPSHGCITTVGLTVDWGSPRHICSGTALDGVSSCMSASPTLHTMQ
jgi:hypothetical protein